jgi:hypothetical protein
MHFVEVTDATQEVKVGPHQRMTGRPRRRWIDAVAVLVCVAISVLTAAWYTRRLYFTEDDFVFLEEARTSTFNLAYLREQLFQHFSPISRVADYILANDLGASYGAARAIQLSILGLAVLAFAWALTGFVGLVWWRHLLTILFAESLALMHLLDWWTATANILPATILGLATIGAFLRFRSRSGFGWGVLTVVFYAFSLLSHEQSWLVFGYLFLFDVLVLMGGTSIRDIARRVVGDWRLWVPLGALTAAAVANYQLNYYGKVAPASLGQMLTFIRILLDEAFAPSAVGFRPLVGGVVPRYAWVIDVAILLAAVVLTIVRAPQAWRPWAVFIIGFLANAALTGLNRVGQNLLYYGREMYYVQAPAYLFLLCLAVALSMAKRRSVYSHRAMAVIGPVPQKWLLASVVVGLLVYQGLFFQGETAQSHEDARDQASESSRSYFQTMFRQIDQLERTGHPVILIDGPVPSQIVKAAYWPLNDLGNILPLLKPGVRFGRPGPDTYITSPTGSLVPAR